ncbi:major facilitator superfamily domain-containing protein 6-like [Portunus trituberculatus]|uniref:major facilitator superfamily domain-containing protein 6-like n=1 Tax=Portunus trituberculatus TaxID=210409 RepID=UPI001E1D0A99|nr:major facilitator superfamily domain-containing protein 6-like [Portunus trituberculatus]
MKTPGWSARVWRDLTTKKFVPLKILYFLVSAATSAMMPFLTLHARSLGILEMELGIVFAVNAVFTILVPTPAGILADKIGNFKVFLSFMMAASGGAALVFSAVPVARRYHNLPESLPLTLSLVDDGLATLSVPPPLQCDYLPLLDNLTITIANCSLCDPGSVPEDGCVPPGLDVCPGQQVEAAGETQMQVNIATSNDSVWNAPYMEVMSWSDAEFLPQSGGEDQWCPMQCIVTVLRPDLCTNTHTLETFDITKTIWLYLMVRILNGITLAASFSLFDGATMAITKQYGGDYGLQRLYSNVGSIVMTPISGALIDYFSDRGGLQDYRPTFYLYCGLKVLAAVVILFLDLDFRQPSSRVLKDFRSLLKKPEILSFLIVMLIAGTCFGVLDTFLFWLLQDLGAQKYLMGITVTVGFSAGVPVLVASGYIFKRLGLPNTIVLGFAVYVVRMLGYSFITNPWWCMPFEALECFTVSLMSAAAVSYAADLATPATLTTLQGLYGGIYHGVGRGLGSLVSGFLMAPLGLRNVFRVLALLCGVTGVLYFTTNCLFFRKLQKKRKVRFEQLGKPDPSDRPAEGETVTDTRQQEGSVTREDGEADAML